MKDQIKNLPLFRKVLLFSFLISIFVTVFTAGISFMVETRHLEKQLTDRVTDMASLWSSVIEYKDVEKVKEYQDPSDPAYKRLQHVISLVNERAAYSNASLLMPEKSDDNSVKLLVTSKSSKEMGLESFSFYSASDDFIDGLTEAVQKRSTASSKVYQDQFGTWISAFSPIVDSKGNIIAILCIDIDAAVLKSIQRDLALYLSGLFLIIIFLVYFVLKRGLKKVLEPINDIISGFKEVSSGNFNVKLKPSNQADLGILSERFNFMTTRLAILFERLSATSEQFGTVPRNTPSSHRFEEAIGEMEHIMERTKILKELQRAEKMNAIGQLAASVAHEIRNPMTVVKGFLQIFLAKEEMTEEEKMYIKLMIDEMDRAETIINDYLSLAKPDIEQVEAINAGELAAGVIDLMNSYAMMSKNISVASEISEGIWIQGNASELKQVLINIYKNGIEAMKNGGCLSLSVSSEGIYGVFEISDTGIGMTREEMDRLGTAFYSLKEKGTGMGLLVCYQIVDRMKGRIEVNSEKGKGTVFRIFIPLAID
ncbi:sensor histidine kinase [Cytobacillus oceanisediminis]|uniref:sensor histidine kinase n=1 Tax=Cytobacillus oceanisediminis TaxID=665099 RepID=UPI001C213391|nr:HAMP domain-containing sensor histidine kinase [Cytobacillus oceanisediminis]MBU8771229.1 two-component sensor histidine kinase [Cytobacillus oceanisediminis]